MESSIKFGAISFLFVLIELIGFSQGNPKIAKALELSKLGQFDQAKLLMDDVDLGNSPQNHYLYGYVLKECYKLHELGKFNSELRIEAAKSLVKAVELDNENEVSKNAKLALGYLSSSWYNDALSATISMDSSTQDIPEELFKNSQTIHQGSKEESLLMEEEFLSKLAEGHYRLWSLKTENIFHLNECVRIYKLLVSKFPGTCSAHLNLAIISYNQGIFVIRSAGTSSNLEDLFTIQDRSIQKFKEALPFAEKSFSDCKPQESNYKVLLYINKALGNEEEVKRIQTEMKKRFQ
jgi:tetratricopeptide (TPR) repeat protein